MGRRDRAEGRRKNLDQDQIFGPSPFRTMAARPAPLPRRGFALAKGQRHLSFGVRMSIIDTRLPDPKHLIPGATGDWEVIIGLEVHAQVTSNAKLFSGASTTFGAPAQLERVARRCGHAGHAAGHQRRMRAPGGANRARAEGAGQLEVGLRPEELFLSRPAAGLSDIAVQATDRRRGQGHRLGRARLEGQFRRYRGRHRTAASRTGRGQVDARPASDMSYRRSQPVRRGADGDRVEAGHALGRRGARLRHQAQDDTALSRHLRRQHGRGVATCRRQRLGAPSGRAVRYALRDQERQLHPFHRPGDRLRGAAADRGHRGRRDRRPGNAAVRSGQGRDALDALQGRGARLPLLPRSGPVAARIRPGIRRRSRGAPAGTAGREEGQAHASARAFRLRRLHPGDGEGDRRTITRPSLRDGTSKAASPKTNIWVIKRSHSGRAATVGGKGIEGGNARRPGMGRLGHLPSSI